MAPLGVFTTLPDPSFKAVAVLVFFVIGLQSPDGLWPETYKKSVDNASRMDHYHHLVRSN